MRIAVFEEYNDPKDGKAKLDGENATEVAKWPETQQITLKMLRLEERDKLLVIKAAQIAV